MGQCQCSGSPCRIGAYISSCLALATTQLSFCQIGKTLLRLHSYFNVGFHIVWRHFEQNPGRLGTARDNELMVESFFVDRGGCLLPF